MASTILSDNGVTSGSAGIKQTADNSGVLALQTTTAGGTATTALTIDTSQNVGIGLAPPTGAGAYKSLNIGAALIYGNTGSALAAYNSNADINDKYIINGFASSYVQSSGKHTWYTAASGSAGGAITYTTQMTLDASGNLLVGTSSKLSGGVDGLDINTTAETGITFAKSGTVKNYFYLLTDASSFQWQTVSGVVVNVVSSTNGVTLTNGATSWGSLSDERKKDIIEPIQNATEKVSSLRTVIGKYKTEEDGIRRSMLIAQDVQAVLPEAVTENANGDLILQYTDTIPLLVAAIKEQQALIQQLQADVAALKGA